MNEMDVWRIAIDPADPDTIFAGTRPAALFRSKDGGRSWQKLPVGDRRGMPECRAFRASRR